MLADGEGKKEVAEVGNGAGLYTTRLNTHMDVIRLSVLASQPSREAGSSMTVCSNVSGVQVTEFSAQSKHRQVGGGSRRPR